MAAADAQTEGALRDAGNSWVLFDTRTFVKETKSTTTTASTTTATNNNTGSTDETTETNSGESNASTDGSGTIAAPSQPDDDDLEALGIDGVLLFYKYTPVPADDLQALRSWQLSLCTALGLKGEFIVCLYGCA